MKNTIETKYYLLKSISMLDTNNWNLVAENIKKAEESYYKNIGLIDNNLIDCGICTVCNFDKFHSYRMEKEDYQANAGIMMLKKK